MRRSSFGVTRWAGLACGLVLTIGGAPAWAQSDDAQALEAEWRDCTQNAGPVDPGPRITACQKILDEGELDAESRALFQVNLAAAYGDAGLIDQGLLTYSAALASAVEDKDVPLQAKIVASRGALRADAQKDYDGALRDLNISVQMAPADGLYRELRGDILVKLKRYAEAVADYDLLRRLTPSDPKSHYRYGEANRLLGDNAKAIEGYSRAIQLKPDFYSAIEQRYLLQTTTRDFNGALADAQSMMRLRPAEPANLYYRGWAYSRLKDYPRALTDLNAYIKAETQVADGYLERGIVYAAQKNAPLAIADFSQAIRLSPTLTTAYMRRASMKLELRDFPGAIADLDVAVQQAPALALNYNNRCWARALWGQGLDLALADCDAAIKMRDTSMARGNRAMVRLRLGQPQLAFDDYEASLKLSANPPASSLYGRGLAHMRLGRVAEGQADMAAALAKDPAAAEYFQRAGLAP